MSALMLYHTNQIENVLVEKEEYFLDKIIFYAFYRPKNLLCPCCHSNEHTLKGVKIRKLRMAPLGNKAAFLFVKLHRLKCITCESVWWPVMPFVGSKKRVTRLK